MNPMLDMAKVSQAYEHNRSTSSTWCRVGSLCAVVIFTVIVASKLGGLMNSTDISSTLPGAKRVNAVTWNVAAINNNPFEYWITNEDPSYNALMQSVSHFIENPGAKDVQVKDVFTEKMFDTLAKKMQSIGWSGVNETRQLWESDYKERKIISGFVKDKMLGKKRLASMPDRVTNTIHTSNGDSAMRPTVINCFAGDLSTMDAWWRHWLDFYFTRPISVNRDGKATSTEIYKMIAPIKKSKYPDITTEEESISKPLQTMAIAIFDAILVHMMNTIGAKTWQGLRTDICQKLNHKKNDRTIEILQTTYADADIQFLQEVAGNFLKFTQGHPIAETFDIYQSASMDPERDQNSFILLKKRRYVEVSEATDAVLRYYQTQTNGTKLPVVDGDLLVLLATDALDGAKYVLASFHGDTNGLATKPVVTAVRGYATAQVPDRKLLFGLDANTYAKPESDQQGVVDFAEFYTAIHLNSCYGPHPNPLNFTTFHARTHLQTQLNKAVSLEEKDKKGDKNPKDFILFFDSDFKVLSTTKDNTGRKVYVENMVFPTLSFPSDHGITSTVLLEVPAGAGSKYLKGSN